MPCSQLKPILLHGSALKQLLGQVPSCTLEAPTLQTGQFSSTSCQDIPKCYLNPHRRSSWKTAAQGFLPRSPQHLYQRRGSYWLQPTFILACAKAVELS